jgi:pyruvate decarboxylase
MKHLLPKLTAALAGHNTPATQRAVPPYKIEVPKEETEIITHTWLWPRVAQFFKPKDVVVGETGTSNFGLLDVPVGSLPAYTDES